MVEPSKGVLEYFVSLGRALDAGKVVHAYCRLAQLDSGQVPRTFSVFKKRVGSGFKRSVGRDTPGAIYRMYRDPENEAVYTPGPFDRMLARQPDSCAVPTQAQQLLVEIQARALAREGDIAEALQFKAAEAPLDRFNRALLPIAQAYQQASPAGKRALLLHVLKQIQGG